MSAGMIGTIVRVRTEPGRHVGIAVVESFCDVPVFGLRDSKGKPFSWRTDLCTPASTEDVSLYWMARAINAENELAAMRAKKNGNGQ